MSGSKITKDWDRKRGLFFYTEQPKKHVRIPGDRCSCGVMDKLYQEIATDAKRPRNHNKNCRGPGRPETKSALDASILFPQKIGYFTGRRGRRPLRLDIKSPHPPSKRGDVFSGDFSNTRCVRASHLNSQTLCGLS